MLDRKQLGLTLDATPERMISIYIQIISAVAVDHRVAWKSYLEQEGYRTTSIPGLITGVNQKGQQLRAEFDAQVRAIGMSNG